MKTVTLKDGLTVTLLAAAVLWSDPGHAGGAQITLQAAGGQFAGPVPDGMIVAQGAISSDDTHTGFRLRIEAQQNGAPQHYTLKGRGGAHHLLNVRITGTDWLADTQTGQGLVLLRGEYRATFRVEVDGNQTVAADTWSLPLQATVLMADREQPAPPVD